MSTRRLFSRIAVSVAVTLASASGCAQTGASTGVATVQPSASAQALATAPSSATFADAPTGHAPAMLTVAHVQPSEYAQPGANEAALPRDHETSCLQATAGERAWHSSECASMCAQLGSGCSWHGQAKCIENCVNTFASPSPAANERAEVAYNPSWSQQIPISGDMECTAGSWGRQHQPWP